MTESKENYLELLYQGLQALSHSALPKKCTNFGRFMKRWMILLAKQKKLVNKVASNSTMMTMTPP